MLLLLLRHNFKQTRRGSKRNIITNLPLSIHPLIFLLFLYLVLLFYRMNRATDYSRCCWLLTLMPYTSLYGAVRIKSILDDLLRDAHQHQNDLFDRLVKYLKKGRSSSNGIVFSVSYYCIPFHGSIRLLRNIRNRSR